MLSSQVLLLVLAARLLQYPGEIFVCGHVCVQSNSRAHSTFHESPYVTTNELYIYNYVEYIDWVEVWVTTLDWWIDFQEYIYVQCILGYPSEFVQISEIHPCQPFSLRILQL